MSRRRKPKTILGMMFSMTTAPIVGIFKYANSYKPMNSRRRRRKRR